MTDPFAAAGTLRDAYRRVDWSATAVGPVESWSPALRAAVDLTLHTRAPVTLFWGSEDLLIYNEAYAPMIGEKHPAALGAPAAKVFAEIWSTIDAGVGAGRRGGDLGRGPAPADGPPRLPRGDLLHLLLLGGARR